MRKTRALACVLALLLLAVALPQPAAAQPNVTGQWVELPGLMPINPIHVGLMRTGKILVAAGSENDPTVTINRAAVYDPATGAFAVQTIPWDLFCNGLSWMPDGRALIAGGNLRYDPFRGIRTTTVFDPVTEQFIQVQDMARGRWYPSVVGLADGRMATFSGWLEGGGTNNALEIYTNPNGWGPENYATFTPALYPWLHLLPDGRVFMSGANVSSNIFNPTTGSWQTGVATTKYPCTPTSPPDCSPRERGAGSSVLLPLSAADNWRPRIMIMGGDNPSTATAEIIDLSQPNPSWRYTNPMSAPRIQGDAVILPTGKILALGGSGQDKTVSTASLNSDLFDPATETWTPAGTMNRARLYHSVALLLPDGTVWAAGSNPNRGDYEKHMEIYKPAYLFDASGGPAARPSVTGSPAVIGYGGSFQVSTPNAASIASVALMRNGSNTHAFDMDQRMISLAFTKGTGTLTVTAPPNANVAPPGYYMLFIVDTNGVPSVAPFIKVASNPTNQLPQGQITSPSGDVTVSAGQSVTFAGSGTDADGSITGYRWIFPGGSPATSTSATPGAVTFSTPGTYYVSLTVTDNQGATDPSPPTRVITVQTATLTASFTTPADGATVKDTVNVGMAASGVTGSATTFTLTINGNQAFSNTTSDTTQTYPWNTKSVSDGVYTLGLTVRDASGATATATRTVTVNNNTPPGTLQVSFPNITPGQTVQGTVPVQIAVAGASGTSNRFTIFVDGAQQPVIVSNATTVTWNWDTTTVGNGSRSITATVQDATGNTGSSFTYVQVQNPTLQVFVTQPSNGSTVSGTAVWTTMWVGGAASGTKTYTLSINGQILATGTDTSSGPVTLPWNSTQVASGPQTLNASVRDSVGAVGSINVSLTVNNGPSASFTSPAQGATVSGNVTVTMAAGGGTAPYTYTLTIDGTQVQSSASTTYSWNTTAGGYPNGNHTLGLTVRDNTGATATATRTVNVQNGPPPLTALFTTPAPGATVSGSVTVTMAASGGTAPYTYTLTIDGTQVQSSASTTYSWNTLAGYPDGSHTLGLTVTDAAGGTAPATRTVTVQNNTPPSASFTTPAAGAIVNGTVTVTMAASGGTAPYTYTLTIDGTQVQSSASTTYSWNTLGGYTDGSHTLGLTVRDAAGTTATATRTVTVQNNGTISVYITQPASGATVTGTQWVIIWINGAAAGTRTFTLTAGGQTVATTNDTSNGPISLPWLTGGTPDGPTTLTASVRDTTNNTGASSIPVTVQNGPSALSASFNTPASGATVSGNNVTVTMAASGGTAPYTYTLTIDGTQVQSSGSTTYSWNTLSGYADGSHTLGLSVRDAAGATAPAARTVTVQNMQPLSASFTTPAAGAVVSGNNVTVTMAASGGTAPYTYTLTIDGTQVQSSGSTTYSWNTSSGYANGNHTLGLTVRDAAGATAPATRTVNVQNNSPITVYITQPASGATVTGTQWVIIWINGAAAGTRTFTLTAGGQTVATTTDTSNGPVSIPWITTGTPNGPTTLTASVSDTTNNTGAISIPVTVANP